MAPLVWDRWRSFEGNITLGTHRIRRACAAPTVPACLCRYCPWPRAAMATAEHNSKCRPAPSCRYYLIKLDYRATTSTCWQRIERSRIERALAATTRLRQDSRRRPPSAAAPGVGRPRRYLRQSGSRHAEPTIDLCADVPSIFRPGNQACYVGILGRSTQPLVSISEDMVKSDAVTEVR